MVDVSGSWMVVMVDVDGGWMVMVDVGGGWMVVMVRLGVRGWLGGDDGESTFY